MNKQTKVLFRLSPETKKALKQKALDEDRSMNAIVNEAIEAYLNANTR